MFYLCEFELYKSGNSVVAIPFIEGEGTFGDNFEDAAESAADWLKGKMEDWMLAGVTPPVSLGNAPAHGGQVVIIGVSHSLENIPAVTAAKAAGILGVSRARVSQMCNAGLLDSWKSGATRYITLDSIEARQAECVRPGRPKHREE